MTRLCSLPGKTENQGLKEGSGGRRSSKLLEISLEQQEDLLSGHINVDFSVNNIIVLEASSNILNAAI